MSLLLDLYPILSHSLKLTPHLSQTILPARFNIVMLTIVPLACQSNVPSPSRPRNSSKWHPNSKPSNSSNVVCKGTLKLYFSSMMFDVEACYDHFVSSQIDKNSTGNQFAMRVSSTSHPDRAIPVIIRFLAILSYDGGSELSVCFVGVGSRGCYIDPFSSTWAGWP